MDQFAKVYLENFQDSRKGSNKSIQGVGNSIFLALPNFLNLLRFCLVFLSYTLSSENSKIR